MEALEDLVDAEVHHGADAVHNDGGNAHLQHRPDGLPAGTHIPDVQMDLRVVPQIHIDAQHRAYGLAQHGGHRRAGNAHLGHAPPAVDKHRVQNDVDDGAGALEDHGLEGPARSLKQPLAEDLDEHTGCEDAADAGIGNAALHSLGYGGLHLVVRPDPENAEEHKQRRGDQRQEYAVARGPVGTLLVLAAQALGQQGVHAYANAHPKSDLQILHGKGQAQSRHRALGNLGHIDAVYGIVQGLDQHGNDHGQGHVHQQFSHRHRAHFVVFHGFHSCFSFFYLPTQKDRCIYAAVLLGNQVLTGTSSFLRKRSRDRRRWSW